MLEILAHVIQNLQLVGIKAQIDVYKMQETDIYVFWKRNATPVLFQFPTEWKYKLFVCVCAVIYPL